MGKDFVACTGYESDPFFELTLWAVLMLRDDLAVLLWRYTEDPIRCCLVSLLMFYRFLFFYYFFSFILSILHGKLIGYY